MKQLKDMHGREKQGDNDQAAVGGVFYFYSKDRLSLLWRNWKRYLNTIGIAYASSFDDMDKMQLRISDDQLV